jgi:hypothetical protein
MAEATQDASGRTFLPLHEAMTEGASRTTHLRSELPGLVRQAQGYQKGPYG